jgi:hypothetical protein
MNEHFECRGTHVEFQAMVWATLKSNSHRVTVPLVTYPAS